MARCSMPADSATAAGHTEDAVASAAHRTRHPLLYAFLRSTIGNTVPLTALTITEPVA